MKAKKTNKYLITAILLGLVFHGTAIFFTLEKTYDALIHLFFAGHYAESWFEPWNYKWYTGFTVMSYPPLVHQSIAVLSYIGGLKFGLFSIAILSILLFITGVYRFSLLITASRKAAGYAAILAVFSSSFVETLHIFGQLPSIIGVAILMHSMPEIYLWLKLGKYRYLCTSLSLMSVMVCSHHVTPIFGMVFFIFPLIGLTVLDVAKDKIGTYKKVSFKLFLITLGSLLKRTLLFCFSSLAIIITCIFPYWYNSKKNPITQIPIPHGSRDNFLEVTSSGMVFFLIPWGILLLILPYIFYRYYSKRFICFGISITMLFVLGTGGTTSIPIKILGTHAFNILTLDRFTLWASIMSLPLFGEFVYRFVEGDLKTLIQDKLGAVYHRILGGVLVSLFLCCTVFTISLGYFRPSQPPKIKMLPIVNFLNQDQHDQWRYLTLGFGDQMAWLSAQTNAKSVDGNYHSARRLPELTTRAIERLENSKFKGIEGIGSLQQFLTVPEKYNLKYIFSNDKFYDPILYFCGWQRLQQLENGIDVWERLNIPPLPSLLNKEDVPTFQKLIWGIIPFTTVIIAFFINIQMIWIRSLKTKKAGKPHFLQYKYTPKKFSSGLLKTIHIWMIIMGLLFLYSIYVFYLKNNTHRAPENVIKAYYNALDFKKYKTAHALVDPKLDLEIAQFMLEFSVSDGILGSYAKLDAIDIAIEQKSDSTAHATVATAWVTPLEKIDKTYTHQLIRRKRKWYIKLPKIDTDLPPNQFYVSNSSNFFNHGRRKVTTEETFHEDVLKLPVLEILSAKLVKNENHYSIIGEIQNVDNIPSDVTLKATLYNDDNKQLAKYNAKYDVKHKLMPKEITSFKINFEGIAWSNAKDAIPKTFNPDEFTPVAFTEQPTHFNLHASGSVTGSDLHKNTVINQLKIDNKNISGFLFNSGIHEVTVPQLLLSHYDKNKELIWVDHFFLQEGIRQERKRYFSFPLMNNTRVKTIHNTLDNCFVNGLPNAQIAKQVVPNRIKNHTQQLLQPIPNNDGFIKIELNNFIGNPK